MNTLRKSIAALLFCSLAGSVFAGMFDDEEARRAILDLRQKVESLRADADQTTARAAEEMTAMRRSLLELQNQIEALRTESAKQTGVNEQLLRDLSEVQRLQKDINQNVDSRFRQFEPIKVTLDGREFLADPAEKRDYEAALALFRKGEFSGVQPLLLNFLNRFPRSGYEASALFWLGNAQYATRDYKEAMINFNSLIAKVPDHVRVPEALLSVANCQVELKDLRGAKKTLDELIKKHPFSEAASAAKERSAKLK